MRRVAVLFLAVLGMAAACSDPQRSAPTDVPAATGAASSTSPASAVATTVPIPSTAATTTVEPSTTQPATSTTASPDNSAASWERVDAPPTCLCADGSPYAYFVREADPTKVVFFMQGGGACFDASSCAFDSGNYKVNVATDDPRNLTGGIFDFANPNNPLADFSFVFVPYCTGDLHLGNATREYSPALTIHHDGSVNAGTALRDMASRFPDATQVVVAGESAGSAPTPLYAGLTHDVLPDAAITVLADGSGAYPDIPGVNSVIGGVWGTSTALPPWPELAALTPGQLSLPGLFVQAHQHDAGITFGRHDYAYDAVQQFFAGLAGIPADDLLTLIDGNEQQIEQAGVDLRSYIAAGNSHTVLSRPEFYTETEEGVPLVEWVTDLVRRQPDLDVHCTYCNPD